MDRRYPLQLAHEVGIPLILLDIIRDLGSSRYRSSKSCMERDRTSTQSMLLGWVNSVFPVGGGFFEKRILPKKKDFWGLEVAN